jgi:Zn-dependent peptidase ImmA (M78 family)
VDKLLRATLDVAHELGHLILDRGPGQMNMRAGIGKNDMENAREVEAEWFALCILQMYGFLFLEQR